MGKSISAIDFLGEPPGGSVPRVCVVFGDEPFLKRHSLLRLRQAVLGGEDAELSLRTFNGPEAEWREVLSELSTRAMFGGGDRLALVENSDPFITANRQTLEGYVERPAPGGVLVLEAATFPSNTKLYKIVAERGLVIECRALKERPLIRWLRTWAKQTHQVELAEPAAELLVDSIGAELGLIDQELAKLALLAGDPPKVTAELVAANVGGSRMRQVWDMLDAALEGRAGDAVIQFQRLLAGGEQPVALLAAVASNLRRLAAATRVVLAAEAMGRRVSLRDALTEAGVKGFVIERSERHLRRLGRQRGGELYDWLLQADLALKGGSSLPPAMTLERLLVRLAAQQPTHVR